MKKFIKAAILACGVALSASAIAESYHFDFGKWLGTSGPSYQPSQSFADLTVSTNDQLTYLFDLNVGTNLNALFGIGAYVDAALFNTISNADPAGTGLVAGIWGVSNVIGYNNAPSVGGVTFDFKDKFGNAQDSRLTQGERVKWQTTFSSLQGVPFFADPAVALHIAGFDQNLTGGVNSGWYTPISPVPEPHSVYLMLTGMLMLGWLAIRRRQF